MILYSIRAEISHNKKYFKMKRLYVLLLISFFVSSCSKNILNTSPNSQVSSTVMWTTDNLTDQGVAGVYAALRLGGGGNGILLYELYSMDRYAYTGQTYYNNELTQGTATPSSGLFSSTWQNLYEGISRANDAITNIPLQSPSDPAKKARYVAECKFLRAYFYFRLAELFQSVPIYTTPTAYNAFTKAASPRDSVWAQCISDLTDAINEPNLLNGYTDAQKNNMLGRVTRGAAYALRGEIYMWQQKWSQAAADFQQVGQSTGYQLYTGDGDQSYKMLFKEAQNNCPEMIFEMQNLATSGYGGTSEFYCGTRSSQGSCWDWYCASNALIDLYENKDGSKFNWDNVIPGYNEMSPAARSIYFYRDSATSAELTAAAKAGADVSKYDATNNESRIEQVYANRDERLQQTIITPYAQYVGVFGGANTNFTWRYPYRSGSSPTFDLQADGGVVPYGFYWYRKFVYEGTSEGTDRSNVPINYPIIRYADVLLQWAEALNESQGLTQQGLDLVNKVRERAGQPDLQMADPALPTYVASTSDFRTRIRNERRVEFPNEGVNYFDELRWGTWLQNKFAAGSGATQIWGTVNFPYVLQGNYITQWPVPTSVVQINSNMAKTPGWTY